MLLRDSIATSLTRILLVGFMGAGKSTVGPLLADRFGWAFHDADKVLEIRSGLSIAELFKLHGEAGFRAMEAETIAALVKQEKVVIALGGGALESPTIQSLFTSLDGTCSVFLDAQLETMLERCNASARSNASQSVRPLLEDLNAIPERYRRRLPFYQKATITVSTEGLSTEAVADIVFLRLNRSIFGQTTSGSKVEPL